MEKLIHSGSLESSPSAREIRHGELARKLAAEGMVLLKNNGLLPLPASAPVAVFGCGAVKTVKGGIGSGDVNNRESISIVRGLREAGMTIISTDWLKDAEQRYTHARSVWKEKILEDTKHVENPFDAYSANPFVLPEGREILAGDLEGASAAIYVISRIAGEGKDRQRTEGDYNLSRKEEEDIRFLNRMKVPVILLLNVGAQMELTDILEECKNVQAVLLVSLPGQEGGRAIADVLLGHAVPGGKLTATWARRYKDYPSAESFGALNGNLISEEYREGIYVGYRYFDCFGVKPLFPFGYGLSYTTFSVSFSGIRRIKEGVEITVFCENTGERYSGREVVQVYVTPPQTEMEKEEKRLAGFAKTEILRPGEGQKLTVLLEQKQFASYAKEACAWVIEAGKYGIWIGQDSASLQIVALLEVEKTTVIEKTNQVCPKTAAFKEIKAPSFARDKEKEWLTKAEEEHVPAVSFLPAQEVKKARDEYYAGEQEVEDLIYLLYGNITPNCSTLGSAGVRVPGSAGETTQALEENYGIPSLIMADGPAGLRLRQSYEVDRKTDTVYGAGVLGSLENGFLEEMEEHEGADRYYQYCTAFPVGTMLAQTWDVKLMERFGDAVALEMKEFYVDLWLAPGMNIQRNPLCGRNFEYYSEDPYLSGMMAAAVTKGVQSHPGCGVTMKHFACNNQEDNRMGVDACVSERALREIYFRGFELAVKKSAPAALMSSYNRINGVYAANSRDLCTILAREEWGFGGVIMSDWNTTVPENGSVSWKCIAAGNDIIMPGNSNDDQNIRQAYEKGELSEETIRSSAGRILDMIRKLTGNN